MRRCTPDPACCPSGSRHACRRRRGYRDAAAVQNRRSRCSPPVCGNKAQLDIVFPFQPVKRSQDRVVLKVGRDHMLARVDAAMDGDVQRLGRVTGERHVVRPLAAKERGELAARVVDHARGGKRLLVRAARALLPKLPIAATTASMTCGGFRSVVAALSR